MKVQQWCFYTLLHAMQVRHHGEKIQFVTACPERFPIADCLRLREGAQVVELEVGFARLLASLPWLRQQWLWQLYRCYQHTHYVWHINHQPSVDQTTQWLWTLTGYVQCSRLPVGKQLSLLPWLFGNQLSAEQLQAVLCQQLPIRAVLVLPGESSQIYLSQTQQSCLGRGNTQLGDVWLGKHLPLAELRCQLHIAVWDRYHFLPGRCCYQRLVSWLHLLLPGWQVNFVWQAPNHPAQLRTDRPAYLGWTVAL